MARILTYGGLNWDRVIHLSAPVAPGARAVGFSQDGALAGRLGGAAANTGAGLALMGHEVAIVATVPDTPDGEAAIHAARTAGLNVERVRRDPDMAGRTLILLDPLGERIVLGLDPAESMEALWAAAAQRDARACAAEAVAAAESFQPEAVYASGFGAAPSGYLALASRLAVQQWPSGEPHKSAAHVVLASARDVAAAAGSDPFPAAEQFAGETLEWVVVTRGADGASAYDGRRAIHVSAPPAQVADATGAGDAFAAGLMYALLEGAAMEAALPHACGWGAQAVAHIGSQPPPATRSWALAHPPRGVETGASAAEAR